MSLSSSIFRKICPDCALSVGTDAAQCSCGHFFESAGQPLSALESTLRDEELYESYLAARSEQADQAARTADENLAGDSSNPELASIASLAKEVAISIAVDLADQRRKLADIRNKIQKLGPTSVPDMPALQHAEPVNPAPQVPTVDISVNAPAWSATTSQKAAAVLAKLKSAKARETIARARQIAAAAREEKQAAVNNPSHQSNSEPKNTSSKVTPPVFRQEQAARAEKISNARQAADTKECPNCTSTIPIGTTRCRCGFGFASIGTDLPSLTLCTGDFTALRDSLKLNLR